jgi:hypothetical protein
LPASNFLVVQTPGDDFGTGIPPGAASGAFGAQGTPSAPPMAGGSQSASQSGKGVTMVELYTVPVLLT